MMKPLSNKTLRIVLFISLIGGGFYLGILAYPYTLSFGNEIKAISTKDFGPALEEGTKKDLILHADKTQITVKSSELKAWLETYHREYSGQNAKRLSASLTSAYLDSLAERLNTEPIDAKIRFQNNKATEFVPSSPGKKLNIPSSMALINDALIENKASVSLAFDMVEPAITLEKINDLGINTLLARGESDYGKSPASRIHNIKVGMARLNGIILKPGEEFSFNTHLGGVDGENDGYQAELVIKNGALVKEFGGGLCQVSTTFFRAAILAGFPILERKPHSFPVQYYNPQGFDSTIYPGVVDLRFTNDTANHALIQTRVVGSKVIVEIYGTPNENRRVVLEGPVQYDKMPSGAMKAYFVRKFYDGDELTKEERFNSVYKAPPAHPLEKNPLE